MAAINTATTESRLGRASPWNQIPRGGELEPEQSVSGESSSSSTPSPPIAEDGGGDVAAGGNAGKRQAWNKQPSNGASEVGPVMGAESWPALGESARVSTKSSSESLKGLSDGLSSISLAQASGTTTMSATTTSPRNQTHSLNHSAPVRPKSKRNYSNASSNGGIPQQQELSAQVHENHSNNPYPKDSTQKSGLGSHSFGGGDTHHRNSFRNRNSSGPHPRGDGSNRHNYGGRRDQEGGNQEWSSPNRSFSGRDSHIQPRMMTRPVRGLPPPPPPSPSPFHHVMRPYVPPPIPYQGELRPHIYYIPPYMGQVPPILVPGPDPELPLKIANQIDYYFSNENLVKDEYLRKKMNKDGGWVPINVVARFLKVRDLTDNIPFILESLRLAKNVEVQADQIRKRNDWKRWIIIPTGNVTILGSQTPGKSSDDNLAARAQSIGREEQNLNSSGSGQSNHQPQFSNGDAGADPSISGRN